MASKFHERFEIEISVGEARQRFVNRVQQFVFYEFLRPLSDVDRFRILQAVAFDLGDPPKGSGTLSAQVESDFLRNMQAIEALYQFIGDADKQKDLEERIDILFDASEVDIGVHWENGQFIRSGAALLDEELVDDPLRWLRASGYETVLAAFEKALSHFLHASKRPELLADVVTDMYESVEALAKIVAGRPEKDLSGNQQLFLSKVKASNEYKQLLRDYIDYANRFRHAVREGQPRPELSPKEVESFVYLTGVFIRLAMPSS